MPNIRKSNKAHLAAGTYRPGRHGSPDSDVVVDAPIGPPPKSLSPEARQEWERVTDILENQLILRAIDEPAFAAYCELCAEMSRPDGIAKMSSARLGFFRQLANDFGLTPASRARLRAPTGKNKKTSFDEI